MASLPAVGTQGRQSAGGMEMDAQQRRISKMRANLQQSMHQQMLEEGGEEMAAALAGDIERMTRQIERLSEEYAYKKTQPPSAPAETDTSRRRATGRLRQDTSGLYARASSVAGEEPPRRAPVPRPRSLPALEQEPNPGVSAATVRRQARRAERPSKAEKKAVEKKKREEVVAKRLAANQPPTKQEQLPTRKKPRPLVVPPHFVAEDALLTRNIREQWKNIAYAIRPLDVNSHMHMTSVASFGGRTGLLYPEQIRKLLSRYGITFSDGYFNLLVGLIDPEPNGEIDYNSFLGMFAKGSRHDDRHAIKPLTNVSFQQARIIVREMIENKLPIGPAPLRRSFQFFDENGSGAIDIHEFKRALHMKANIAFEQSMLEKLMAFYDDDSSGSINFRKFCENVMDSRVGQADCITKVKPQGQKNVVSSDAGTSEPFLKRKIQMEKKNLRMAFKARDSTGLGVVKVTDLRELLEKYDINMTDNQFATLVTQMDHNGDGVITYAEFLRYFSRDLDATTVLKPIGGITVKQAMQMVKENLEAKLSSGPSPLRRCWVKFDTDGSGAIDFEEMKHALLMQANLVFEDQLLRKMMDKYDDDNTGEIDYRKFCENVMGSHPDDAGGWGSSATGSNARIPGSEKARKKHEQKMQRREKHSANQGQDAHPLGESSMPDGLNITSMSMQQRDSIGHGNVHRKQAHIRGSPGFATATGNVTRVA